MTARGKVVCVLIIWIVVFWWLVLAAVKLTMELLMPIMVWMQGQS